MISKNTFLDNCTLITQYERYISFMEFDVEPNTTYWLKTNYYTKRYATWYITNTVGSGVVNSAINGILSEDTPKSATSDSNGKLYVWGRTISTGTDTKIVQDMTDSDYIMLVKSDTAPSTYIPYGYEISITLTDGTNSEDYVLYIGDSKLGENEHLSFAEQKIYKDVSGTLTPTDPPAAFPAITAYAGENTLSSTETVGNVTIKGIIKAVT